MLLLVRIILLFACFKISACQYDEKYLTCDEEAAIQCEYEFLQCRLFTGPADDAATMCACGENFYGKCIRAAGCEMNQEFDPLGKKEIYTKKCIDHIMKYNCPSTLMCSINCESDEAINKTNSRIIPFNNYGATALRIRICSRKIHSNKLSKYSQVTPQACESLSDFLVCQRWVPPLSFIPVAIPAVTTYLEIDYCAPRKTGGLECETNGAAPSRVYGSDAIFPATFDVAQTAVSICSTNGTHQFMW